jgi:hypothetical protein
VSIRERRISREAHGPASPGKRFGARIRTTLLAYLALTKPRVIELLLVTTLDVPTLKNVKIACETLDLLNFPKPRRHLVLNRADDKVGLAPEKVETTLDMKIPRPVLARIITLVAARAQATAPFTLTDKIRSKSSSFRRKSRPSIEMPALHTKTSSRPRRLATSAIDFSAASLLPTSNWISSALPPSAWICSATARAAASLLT